jgi:AraC-like DNA-binding protein
VRKVDSSDAIVETVTGEYGVTVSSASLSLAHRTVTSDGDEFLLAAPGIEGRLIRTGRGTGDAALTAWDLGSARIGLLEFGFPSSGGAGVLEQSIVLATILAAPPGGLWDGRPMAEGETFIYPTGASQHATDPAGLRLALTSIAATDFDAAARDLGYDPTTATKKVVRDRRILATLSGLCPGASTDTAPLCPASADQILDAAVRAACLPPLPVNARERTRRASDIELVDESIRYLNSQSQWRLPLLALCRHVNVSERRLQIAFHRILGIGPLAFMQQRALQAAHQHIKSARSHRATVASIARSHGFSHAGRFAQRYTSVYGEPPSTTLYRH